MNYLKEAFKELDLLDEEVFSVGKKDELLGLSNFLNTPATDQQQAVNVFDPNAEEQQDLEMDYTGSVVLQCQVCGSLLYKQEDEVVYDENSDLVNIEDTCPICGATQGFTVIGQVVPYEPEKPVDGEIEPIEDEEEPEEEPEETDESESEEEETVEGEELEDNDDGDVLEEEQEEPDTSTHREAEDGFILDPEICVGDYVQMVLDGEIQSITDKDGKRVTIPKPYQLRYPAGDIGIAEDGLRLRVPRRLPMNMENTMSSEDASKLAQVVADKLNLKTELVKAPSRSKDTRDIFIIKMDEDIYLQQPAERIKKEFNITIDPPQRARRTSKEESQIEAQIEAEIETERTPEMQAQEVVESYLTSKYKNVKSFKVEKLNQSENGIMVEGVASFEDGNKGCMKFNFVQSPINEEIYHGTARGFNESFTLRVKDGLFENMRRSTK